MFGFFSKQNLAFFTLTFVFLMLNQGHAQSDSLMSTNNQADYLIISDSLFFDTLDSLVQYRESQGLKVRLVSTNEIYKEFQDTLTKKEAIRNFVSYALEYWQEPKPQYLLLAGDSPIIPAYRVQSQFHESYDEDSVAIDDYYAINKYQDDQYPDIAIGRFPASTKQQLANMIHKTIYFETKLKRADYPIDFLGIADYRKNESVFEYQANDFVQNYLPDYYSYKRIDRRSDSPYHGTRDDIINDINQGTLFLSFYGHGNPFIWGDTSFFDISDLERITSNGLPFVFTGLTSSQSFDLPDTMSIVEKFLCKPNGGAVISFASVGLNYTVTNNNMIDSLYKTIFNNPTLTVGKMIEHVKRTMSISDSPDDMILRFSLLGDPALKFPQDIVTGFQTSMAALPNSFVLNQNFPNPFNASTKISFDLHTSGRVRITVYDVNGARIGVLMSGYFKAGHHEFIWNPVNLASGMYLIRMEFNKRSAIIKTLYLK